MIWHAKKWKVNVCVWFIYGTVCWILLFLIWQSELCGQHCTRAVLHQSDCFEYPLKLPKIKRPKMSIDIYIFQSFLYLKKSRDEKFRNKKEISLSSRKLQLSPPPSLQPPPWAGPRVKHYCLHCSFWLLVVVRHFSPFLCFSWFLSVWKYPNALCNCIAICCIKPV